MFYSPIIVTTNSLAPPKFLNSQSMLAEEVAAADGLVMGSPIYFAEVTRYNSWHLSEDYLFFTTSQ